MLRGQGTLRGDAAVSSPLVQVHGRQRRTVGRNQQLLPQASSKGKLTFDLKWDWPCCAQGQTVHSFGPVGCIDKWGEW